MPFQAVWAAIDGKVVKGKLDISALHSISPEIDSRLVIFTEDRFAKKWVESMLRSYGGIAVDLINVYAMEGDGTAAKVNIYHNRDPATKAPSICFIDGDSRQVESSEQKIFRLPGGVPVESLMFGIYIPPRFPLNKACCIKIVLHSRQEQV